MATASKYNPVVLRLAQITAVHLNSGTVQLTFYDSPPGSKDQINVPMPTAFASRGWGILSGVEEGTWAVVGFSHYDKPFILTTIAPTAFFKEDLADTQEARFDQHTFRSISTGSLCMQSRSKSIVEVSHKGDVLLRGPEGDNIVINNETRSICQDSLQNYQFTEAHRKIAGAVLRDLRTTDGKMEGEGQFLDRMKDPSFDLLLEPIGKNPTKITLHLDTGKLKRNVSLAEHREVFYEFADSFNVDEEIKVEGKILQPPDTVSKQRTRSNVLSIKRNEIIESIKGNIVDINGNILDVNLEPIDIHNNDSDDSARVKLCRSGAFHFTVNTRRDGVSQRNPFRNSKWSTTIDKEGLTKINIPASSILGTIPRHLDVSHTDFAEDSSEELDERLTQVQTVEQGGGQLYHNITHTARRTLYAGTDAIQLVPLDSSSELDSEAEELQSVTTEPLPATDLGDPLYNPAGISLFSKFDGMWAASLGKNEQDGNSLVLDTSGKIITHYGTDNFGRSAFIDYDGSVRIHVNAPTGFEDSYTTEPSKQILGAGFDFQRREDPEDDESDRLPFITELGGTANSIKLNTEGTCEFYIGSDQTDGKSLILQTDGLAALVLGENSLGNSLVLDSQGSLDLQIGTAKDGHSIGIQTEGAVVWNIGGGCSTMDRKENPNPGKFDLRTEGIIGETAGTGAQRLMLDTNGIMLSADGNITLDTRAAKGTGQIVAIAQKEVYLESREGGIMLKSTGVSSDLAGIILDCPTGIMLKSGPQYIHLTPQGIILSTIPVVQGPSSPDDAPPEINITDEIVR